MLKAQRDRSGFQEVLLPTAACTERRRGGRFSLRLSCRVRLLSKDRAEFAGTIINISRCGILVGLDSAHISGVLRPDAVVRVAIDLPRHPSFSARCMECAATVVRVVAAEAETQVAFEIGRMRVKDQAPKAIPANDWLSASIRGPIQ